MTRMMNLTAALGLGALVVMGPGCAGDKGSDAGTDTSETEGDADTDTDSDGDTDTEPAYFEDYVVFVAVNMGYDGFGPTDYYLPGDDAASPSFAQLTFVEEAYFETGGDEEYTCTYAGVLSFEEPLDLGVESAWYGSKVSLVGGNTDCENFDPARYGLDGNPVEAIESLSFGIGYGPLEEGQLETALIEAFDREGLDFETEGRPYYFTGYVAISPDGGDTYEAVPLNYTTAYVTDDDMELVVDEADNLSVYDGMDEAVELPYPSLVYSPGYFGLYTSSLFP